METVAQRRKRNRMAVALGLCHGLDKKTINTQWVAMGTSRIAELCDHPIASKYVTKQGRLECRDCNTEAQRVRRATLT